MMRFAHSLPWWLALALLAAIALVVFAEYRRPLSPLSRLQRGALVSVRFMTLALIVLFLFRPMIVLPPTGNRDAVVPVLVDSSRSMRLPDDGGRSREAGAAAIVTNQLLPALSGQYRPELFSVGDGLTPVRPEALNPTARRTDLVGAIAVVRERYRGQRVAGIVLLSDGGDTGQGTTSTVQDADGPPVFAIGIGSPDGPRDREVLGITAGDPRLDHASVDLHVTAVSSGFGRTPFQLRVLANGRLLETRRVTPPADGSPIDEVFTVSPEAAGATVFSADIPVDPSELVAENNSRAVLVRPAGRKRRVLVLEGAPGFEHSFMKRALAEDPGLEVDSVTRKGRNAENQDTFFVQASEGRSSSLTSGFPARREDLFAYDAVIIANIEGDYFANAKLALVAEFVSERGGGLLVMGGRSFAKRGLASTPLEEALPVELNNRRGSVVLTSLAAGPIAAHNKVVLTRDGETHPIMRIGGSVEETRKLWAALPALAASAVLGGPRPGASVLALTTAPGGGIFPVAAVQRYGQGRSMIFAGEASWRWKMMVPSTDRAHEFFWRQAVRWLAASAPDPVAIGVPDAAEPGDSISVDVDARDASFAPVPDANVEATLTAPGSDPQPIKLRRADGAGGRFTAAVRPDRAGLYRVHAEARRGTTALGSADQWMLVGGADREFADPRLNEGFLRRLARTSGGRYGRTADAANIPSWLRSAAPQKATPERRDLWHQPWALAIVIVLLSTEWILRRAWGLR